MFLTTTEKYIQESRYPIMAAQDVLEDSCTWISRYHICYFICKTCFCI